MQTNQLTTTNRWRHFGQWKWHKSFVLFPIQSGKSPDSGFFTCDPTNKCIMPSSRERHKGLTGRGHDTLLAEAFPLCFSALYCHSLGCSRFVLVVSVPRKRPLQTAVWDSCWACARWKCGYHGEAWSQAKGVKKTKACFKRRATAVLSWLDCSSTAARH